MQSRFFLIIAVLLIPTTPICGFDDYSSRIHDKRAYIKFCNELVPIDDALSHKYDVFIEDLEAHKLPKTDTATDKYYHGFTVLIDKLHDVDVPELSNIFAQGALQRAKNNLIWGYERRLGVLPNYLIGKKHPPVGPLTNQVIFGDASEDQLTEGELSLYDAGRRLGFDAWKLNKILKYPPMQ